MPPGTFGDHWLPVFWLAVLGTMTLSSCTQAVQIARCPGDLLVTDREFLDNAINTIVLQSAHPRTADEISYASAKAFRVQNPLCCYLTKPEGYKGGKIALTLGDNDVQVAIVYRSHLRGEKPYTLRYVSFGPCASDMEESEQDLSEAEYLSTRRWRWNWRIK